MSGHCQGIPDGGATGSASEPAAESVLFIGKIETVAGSCTLTRSGDNPVQVKPGDPVCQGDIIETAADGKVGIRFIDGTVFNLSDHGRIVLKEFAGGGVSPSALFDVSDGTFAFIAGEMAKAGRLNIDTPFASIRSRDRAGGIGMLSLASLFFTALEDAQAKDPDVSFLDDGQIRFRDLTNEYGVVELALKTFPPPPSLSMILAKQSSCAKLEVRSPRAMSQIASRRCCSTKPTNRTYCALSHWGYREPQATDPVDRARLRLFFLRNRLSRSIILFRRHHQSCRRTGGRAALRIVAEESSFRRRRHHRCRRRSRPHRHCQCDRQSRHGHLHVQRGAH